MMLLCLHFDFTLYICICKVLFAICKFLLYYQIMKKTLSVKLKEQKIKVARLASVLHITRPTLYRYLELFDQNKKQLIPKQARMVLQQIEENSIRSVSSPILSIPGTTPQDLLRKVAKPKEALIKLIQSLDEEKDGSLIQDLLTLLRTGKQQSLLRLVKRLSFLVGKNMPSGKLEHEVEWLIDYITHKHSKDNVNETFFD